MTRLLSPDTGCASMAIESPTTGQTVSYDRGRDGLIRVENPMHVRALKQAGATVAGTRINGRGFVCNTCGFVALIRDHCGRCGGTTLTPEEQP